jgi:hypothetical protein
MVATTQGRMTENFMMPNNNAKRYWEPDHLSTDKELTSYLYSGMVVGFFITATCPANLQQVYAAAGSVLQH